MSGDLVTLFPPYGIDQTIHVAILIGVLLLLAFTEWFGWVFSGLVVPGYLASLFVLEPAAGATVLVESVLTFVIAKLLSNVASRSGSWSLFFGRERFLLLIFISIAVRQASELWLLPEALRVLDDQLDTTYRLTRTFSSVGLVLVPLTANMFWKLDLRRGLVQVAVPTAITFAILAYVLLPYTNLSFSRLEITYENVALDFLSSPKAYILLVAGAYLGSRWNLLYGWDYAGILVPALLGLALVSPMRLVTTLVETLLLVIVVRTLIRVPGFRTMNLEGPRKVALVFTVSFVLKWILGWIVGPSISDVRITELFGFGYLLSSLMAVKILQKDTISRIAVPTLVVSAVTFGLGNAIGFGLDRVAPEPEPVVVVPPASPTPTTTVLAQSAAGVLALGHVRARVDVAGDVPLERSDFERGRYGELWSAIAAWLDAGSPQAKLELDDRVQRMGLALRPLDKLGARDAWGLFELEERLVAHVGWDTAVLIPGARGPVIAVPRPMSEPPTAEVAAALCARTDCRAVIVSGIDAAYRPAFDADRAPHAVARRALDRIPALELRADRSLPAGRSVLHVANEAPDVNVAAMWPRGLELSWQVAPSSGERYGASVLRAHPDDYWKVIIGDARRPIADDLPIEGWFAAFFERPDPGSAPAITNQPPSQSELRFLQLLVATPALEYKLDHAHAMARLIGYAAYELPSGVGASSCWIVAEAATPRRLGWGVIAGRLGGAPLAIEVPRPRREAGTWRLGVELWRHSSAATLVVADGDVPDERADADPAATWNVMTAFQAFHQAVHDVRSRTIGSAILQIRGFGVTQPIREAMVVTMARPILGDGQLPPQLAKLLEPEGALGFVRPVRLNDGARELGDVTGTGNPQLHYCSKFENVDCAMLWFSELTRDVYREVDRDREMTKLARMSVPVVTGSAADALVEPPLDAPEPARIAAARARFGELTKIAEAYSIEQNVQLLRVLVNRAAESGGAIAVRGGYSAELGRPFLVVELRQAELVLRGLVLVPSGSERIDLAAGSAQAGRVPELLARRPRLITLAGRSAEAAPAPAPAPKVPAKRKGRGR